MYVVRLGVSPRRTELSNQVIAEAVEAASAAFLAAARGSVVEMRTVAAPTARVALASSAHAPHSPASESRSGPT